MTTTEGPGPGPGPIRIPPPRPVQIAGLLLCLQALGVVVLTVVILVSGFAHHAAVGQLSAQAAYFLVVALGMFGCAVALLRGRRWARTPTIVVQLVLGAVGYWLMVPSGRPGWGIAAMLVAVVTGGLLLTPPANRWIGRFPALFGPEPGR